ncbi:carboxylating nicotinate-nucleotide diphosphorylase [uncultured Hyphomicrobium sp.]|uniref:carboxylating nicotinate-nucleotide diphosphorylase n=1 Tax=uncultured Hyphomicrobium sp. TaxID=194373 RepID=UPI0025DC799D|nr:carboxylating nicotinate-nucleotide diphosphorylase [uncultured Hyphomicrobium sp.]
MSTTPVSTADFELPRVLIARAIEQALAEDLGVRGDLTTDATVPRGTMSTATFGARRAGVISGLAVAEAAFHALDPSVVFEPLVRDGARVAAGSVAARVAGSAHALLTGERVALNFLSHMSGIATLTRRYVDLVAGTRARIVDTRKTTPGLRAFEKYAVRCGGGQNHRSGLYDAILIKDNHIVAAGGIAPALAAARAHAGHMVKIEIEVTSLDELADALKHPVDAVLLDNMEPPMLREAVALVDGRAITEASGGVSLDTVRAIAESGVDLISIGALTHSAPILDLGLDFTPQAG